MTSSSSSVESYENKSFTLPSVSNLKTYGFIAVIILGFGGLAAGGVGAAYFHHVGSLSQITQIDAIIMIAVGGGGGILCLIGGSFGVVKQNNQFQTTIPISAKSTSSITIPEVEEKVDEAALKRAQQALVQDWMDKFCGKSPDYIAHAIWNGNFEQVLKSEAILPGEAVLRTKKVVEYEKGSAYGSRGTTTSINLSTEEIEEMDKHNLNPDYYEPQLFDYLESFFEKNRFTDGEEHLSKCSKEVREDLEKIKVNDSKTLKQFKDSCQEALDYLSENDRLLTAEEENKLNAKSEISASDIEEIAILRKLKFRLEVLKIKRRQLKYLQRRKETGIIFNSPIVQITFEDFEESKKLTLAADGGIKPAKEFTNTTKHNGKKLKTYEDLIQTVDDQKALIIAYDQAKGNPVDQYLSRKYVKWMKKEPEKKQEHISLLRTARERQFDTCKLNAEVRAARNAIRWEYGNIAVLRGNTTEIIRTKAGGLVPTEEVFLLPPFMNGGEFFTLPLVQEDTIIISTRKELEPHAQKLKAMGAKFAYIENLTEEQQRAFRISK